MFENELEDLSSQLQTEKDKNVDLEDQLRDYKDQAEETANEYKKF